MRNRCETCDGLNACRRAFGRYWGDRSSGGTGCDHRIPLRDADAFPAAGGAKREQKQGRRAARQIALPVYEEEMP